MDHNAKFVLLVLAFLLCLIAGLFYPRPAETPWYGRVHFGWLGMAAYFASLIF